MLSLLFEALEVSRAFLKSSPFSPFRRHSRLLFRREEPNKLSSVEEMGRAEGKIGDEEELKEGEPVAAPFDLSSFTVIKEGEAEILMLARNEVFYNKSQVRKNHSLLDCI